MKLIADPPFYPGEVVFGTVVRLCRHFAELNVRGYKIPLDTRLISWDEISSASSILEIGQRIEVMALTRNHHIRQSRQDKSDHRGTMSDGYWLTRLPLLENPWPVLAERYPDGSVVEVELIEFGLKNDAIVQFPEGARTRVPMIGLDRYAKRHNRLAMRPLLGESFRVTVRGTLNGKYWLQPYFGLPPKVLP